MFKSVLASFTVTDSLIGYVIVTQ